MNWKPVNALLASFVALAAAGCTPPSVSPLLELSRQAVAAEAQRLRADIERDRAAMDHARDALEAAYAADLHEQSTLDVPWVMEATVVYVAAREAVLRQEMALRRERERRADNLDAAADATGRAVELLEQRDRLLNDTAVARWWRMLGEAAQGVSR